jgi:hypothetical protein
MGPLRFTSGGVTISSEEPGASTVALAPGVVACPSAEPAASLAEQVAAIRRKAVIQRTEHEHALVAQYFESQAQQLNALDPISRAARCGGYIPGEGTPDLSADLEEVTQTYRRWR